jgi:hypothetical protein
MKEAFAAICFFSNGWASAMMRLFANRPGRHFVAWLSTPLSHFRPEICSACRGCTPANIFHEGQVAKEVMT